jgi:chromosome segregation ATPase
LVKLYYEVQAREQRLELEGRRLQFHIDDSKRRKEVAEAFIQFREKKLQQQAERAAARANERAAIRDAKASMKKHLEAMERRQREQERTAAAQRAALSPLADLRWGYAETVDQDANQPPRCKTPASTGNMQHGREEVPAAKCA